MNINPTMNGIAAAMNGYGKSGQGADVLQQFGVEGNGGDGGAQGAISFLPPPPAQQGRAADSVSLSPDAMTSLSYTRAQFEVNYQAIRAVSGPQGATYEQIDFSFSASFEFLQAASGGEPISMEGMDGQSLIEKMQEIFSPEKTAGRILDFALSHYAPEGEDTEGARQEFADYIGGLVQKGFDEAQKILGELEESIQKGIDTTHELVFKGLDDFVQNGVPEDHAERSERIRAYAESFSAQVSYSFSRVEARSGAFVEPQDAQEAEPEAETPGALPEPFEAQA